MGVHEGEQQLGHLESTLASNGRAPRQRGRSMAPKWARPTMVVSRRPIGPHHLQLPLVGRHVSPYTCCTCLSFGYVGFLLHVGP